MLTEQNGLTLRVIDGEFYALKAERDALRQVCAEAYQMAGAIDAPIEALDNLSAAANGCPIPHKTFLPIFGDRLAAHDAEVANNIAIYICDRAFKGRLSKDEIIHYASEYAAQLRDKAKR